MGGVLGPFWGAAITQFAGWRWIFYINLPLAALLAMAVLRYRERSDPGSPAARLARRDSGRLRPDLAGRRDITRPGHVRTHRGFP